MFDTRWRKVWGELWLHRARSLLVVLAVAIGLIGAGSVLNAWALVERATDRGYGASLPVSATLIVDRLNSALLAEVRALPEIGGLRMRRTVHASARADGTWRKAVIYAMDDFENPEIARLQADVGTWPPADGSVVIERSSLEFSGASVGAGILLRVGENPQQSVYVSGIVRDVSLAPGWMEHVVYAYASTSTLARLGAPAGFDELQIRVNDTTADRAAVRRIAYAVKTLIESRGGKVAAVEVPEPGEHIHAAQMNSLLLTQAAFGLLSLLVCAFLVVNLINAILAGQTREIGVMKALGASSAQIAKMYYAIALIFGLMASSIALPASIAIGREYAEVKADMLNFSIVGYAVPWWAIALQLVVGCLLPVAAAVFPVRRAARMPVAAALRDIGIVAPESSHHLRRVIRLSCLGRPLILAIGNAFRRRQRMLLTLLALALGGAVYLGAENLRMAVRGSVDLLFSSQRFDVVLRMDDAQPSARLEAIASAMPGVLRAEAWRRSSVALMHDDDTRSDDFSLIALPAGSQMLRPRLDSGRWFRDDEGDVLVVSRRLLSNEPGLRVGSVVDLQIDGRRAPWTVVGVMDDGPQAQAYAPRTSLDRHYGNAHASTLVIALSLPDRAAQLDATLRIRAEFERDGIAIGSSQLMAENRRVFEDHLLMVVDFLGAMGWVMLVVGGMGLASTMSLGVLERTREIGVLRAIGAGHGAIMAMIQVEGLVVATLGWLLAIPLSIPMSLGLGYAFGRIMFTLPTLYLPGPGAIFSWLALTLAIAVVACAWPALRAVRVPTARALSYE